MKFLLSAPIGGRVAAEALAVGIGCFSDSRFSKQTFRIVEVFGHSVEPFMARQNPPIASLLALSVRTLEEHLSAAAVALEKIGAVHSNAGPQPICHHFNEATPTDPIEVSRDEVYRPLIPLFAAMQLEFLPDRLEAWETITPDREWAAMRIPAVFDTAHKSALIYQGWSWEPRDRAIISATTFPIIDNRGV